MSTRTTRSGVKRRSDAADNAPTTQPSKRSKSNSKKSQPKGTTKDDDQDNLSPSCATKMNPSTTSQDPQPEAQTPRTLTLPESTGDIFSAPPSTLLIHACNTEGSWGAGIAAAFRKNYPDAYPIYSAHCRKHGAKLHATALLIPPQAKDPKRHFVGCLFTSRSKGKKKDSPKTILEATGPAMRDLLRQVEEFEGEVGEVRMCKINSGLFGVPWEETKAVLEGIEVGKGNVQEVKVISREE